MRKFYIVGLVVVAALVIGLAYAEQMIFSTYYPAPYGRYRQFSTTGLTTLATDEFGNEGATALVGIGTTDPTEILEVESDGDTEILVDAAGDARLTLDVEQDTSAAGVTFKRNGVSWGWLNYDHNGGGVNQTLLFGINAAHRMAIDGNGKVGIGANFTHPNYILDLSHATHPVVGFNWTDTTGRGENMFFQGSTFYGGVGAFGSAYADSRVRQGLGMTSGVNNNGFLFFRTKTGGTYQDRMWITNAGNMGIGTRTPEPHPTDPSGNLDVNDIWLRSADNDAGAWLSESGGARVYKSGWFPVTIAETYTVIHDLGQAPDIVEVYFSDNAAGTNVHKVHASTHTYSSYGTGGYFIDNITVTQLELKTGQQDVAGLNAYPNDDGQRWGSGGARIYGTRQTTGYYRVVAAAL